MDTYICVFETDECFITENHDFVDGIEAHQYIFGVMTNNDEIVAASYIRIDDNFLPMDGNVAIMHEGTISRIYSIPDYRPAGFVANTQQENDA